MTILRRIVSILTISMLLVALVNGLAVDNAIMTFGAALSLVAIVTKDYAQRQKSIFILCEILAVWNIIHILMVGSDIDWLSLVLLVSFTLMLAMYNRHVVAINRWIFSVGCILLIVCSIEGRVPPHSLKCAYLERGNWGVTHTQERKLNIRSQYSYSLLCDMLGATKISNIDNLNEYNELWVITPTHPFIGDEKESIYKWVVIDGGKLVVVVDHTDLFGHASVANELLSWFGLTANKDCVIGRHGEAIKYFSLIGGITGLSANTIVGRGTPFLLQCGYRERADYSKRSFFSDNVVTDEDQWGIYGAGIYRRCGKGSVIVFGDSTMFANFALSRPSSQLVVRMLRDSLFFINLCFICLCLVIIVRVWDINKWYMHTILALVLSCLLLYIVTSVVANWQNAKLPLFKMAQQTCEVRGGWGLVDEEDSQFAVLFASVYAQAIPFPVWGVWPETGKNLFYGHRHLHTNGADDMVKEPVVLDDLLSNPPSMTPDCFIQKLIDNAAADNFWFDSGVGLFREIAYSNFWNCVSSNAGIVLGDTFNIAAKYYTNGEQFYKDDIKITKILGHDEWCLVGDWMIGKFVDDEILIHEKWQDVHRRFGNIVIQPISK